MWGRVSHLTMFVLASACKACFDFVAQALLPVRDGNGDQCRHRLESLCHIFLQSILFDFSQNPRANSQKPKALFPYLLVCPFSLSGTFFSKFILFVFCSLFGYHVRLRDQKTCLEPLLARLNGWEPWRPLPSSTSSSPARSGSGSCRS